MGRDYQQASCRNTILLSGLNPWHWECDYHSQPKFYRLQVHGEDKLASTFKFKLMPDNRGNYSKAFRSWLTASGARGLSTHFSTGLDNENPNKGYGCGCNEGWASSLGKGQVSILAGSAAEWSSLQAMELMCLANLTLYTPYRSCQLLRSAIW